MKFYNYYTSNYIVDDDGTLLVSGQNNSGQLGDGTLSTVTFWKPVLTDVAKFVRGPKDLMRKCLFAIKTDGTLWGTGDNEKGQIGDGTTTTPVKTWTQVLDNVINVATGNFSTYAIKNDNSLWAIGSNSSGQLGNGSTVNSTTWIHTLDNVVEVAAGSYHCLARKADGSVWACGDNSQGQIGVSGSDNKTWKQVLTNVAKIYAIDEVSYAIKNDNTLWVCGDNACGQLGDGTTYDIFSWKQVLTNVSSVSINGSNAFAIKLDKTMWGTGLNTEAGLGDGTKTNVLTWKQLLTNVINVYNDDAFMACAVRGDNTLWVCGQNYYGQLNTSSTSGDYVITWKQADTGVAYAYANGWSGYVVKLDGTIIANGTNSGEFGNDYTTGVVSWLITIWPVAIPTLSACTVSNISTTSAKVSSSLVSRSNTTIRDEGICYGKDSNPTIDNFKISSSDIKLWAFSANLGGLEAGTEYHARSFATNGVGTGYGPDITFTTAPKTATASVSTALSESNINGNTITLTLSGETFVATLDKANFTLNNQPSGVGIDTVTRTDSTHVNVTLVYDGTDFDTNITNMNITIGGNQLTGGVDITSSTVGVTAIVETVPVVSTSAATSITTSAASVGGSVSSDGGEAVTEKGICYDTTVNPTTASLKVTSGTGAGVISANLTGLVDNTTYHARAYAINSVGIAYGNDITFTTLIQKVDQAAPSIPVASSITETSFILTSSPGAYIMCNSQLKLSGSTWTGLQAGTTYSAYAYLPGDSTHNQSPNSNTVDIKTLVHKSAPTVTIGSASNITQTGFTITGDVTSDGNDAITERGFLVSSSNTSPTENGSGVSKFSVSAATGSMSESVTALALNTLYYVVAYAKNLTGIAYSNVLQVTTLGTLQQPTPAKPTASKLTSRTVVLTSDTGSMIVCNNETKPSGSVWSWLTPSQAYTAYAYNPPANGKTQSNNSLILSFTTPAVVTQEPVLTVSGIMTDGTKAPASEISGKIKITASNDCVQITGTQILAVKTGTCRIAFEVDGKTTYTDITIV